MPVYLDSTTGYVILNNGAVAIDPNCCCKQKCFAYPPISLTINNNFGYSTCYDYQYVVNHCLNSINIHLVSPPMNDCTTCGSYEYGCEQFTSTTCSGFPPYACLSANISVPLACGNPIAVNNPYNVVGAAALNVPSGSVSLPVFFSFSPPPPFGGTLYRAGNPSPIGSYYFSKTYFTPSIDIVACLRFTDPHPSTGGTANLIINEFSFTTYPTSYYDCVPALTNRCSFTGTVSSLTWNKTTGVISGSFTSTGCAGLTSSGSINGSGGTVCP